jgi:hypothetical protein
MGEISVSGFLQFLEAIPQRLWNKNAQDFSGFLWNGYELSSSTLPLWEQLAGRSFVFFWVFSMLSFGWKLLVLGLQRTSFPRRLPPISVHRVPDDSHC